MGFFRNKANAKAIRSALPLIVAVLSLIIGTAIISVHCTAEPIVLQSNLACYNCTCQTCPSTWDWYAKGGWTIQSNSTAFWSWNSSGKLLINGQLEPPIGSLFSHSFFLESNNAWTGLSADPLITCPMPHAWIASALTGFFAMIAALLMPFKGWKLWESLITSLLILGGLIAIVVEFYILQQPGLLIELGLEWSFNKAQALLLGMAWSHLLKPRITQSVPIGCLAVISILAILLGDLAPPELAYALVCAGASTISVLLWKAESVALIVHLQLIGLALLIYSQGYPIALAIAGSLAARLYKLPALYALASAVVASVAAFLLSNVDGWLIGWAIAIVG